MLLSVLVPVYNVASYLERCMKSLLSMPMESYEVILVDDGSTDESGNLCDEFKVISEHVQVVHQKHLGLVATRSSALAIARGKYVAFVDSDDWVDKELLPQLVSDLEYRCDIDIAVGRTVRSQDECTNVTYLTRSSEVMERNPAIRAMVNKDGMHWYLWGKVYRRELFDQLIVDESVTVFEDIDRLWPVVKRAEKILFDDKYAYHYFINQGGMTKQRCDLNISSWRVFKRILLDGPAVDCVKQEMANYYVQVFLRHTIEMYFVDKYKFSSKINLYIREMKETLHISQAMQNILSDKEYKAISTDYTSCVDFYDNIFLRLKHMLIHARKDFHYMYIYGIGVVAQYIAAVLNELNLSPDAYIVSDGELKSDSFMDRPVYYLSEVSNGADVVFILALTGKAEMVVSDILYERNERLLKGKSGIYSVGFPPMIF